MYIVMKKLIFRDSWEMGKYTLNPINIEIF